MLLDLTPVVREKIFKFCAAKPDGLRLSETTQVIRTALRETLKIWWLEHLRNLYFYFEQTTERDAAGLFGPLPTHLADVQLGKIRRGRGSYFGDYRQVDAIEYDRGRDEPYEHYSDSSEQEVSRSSSEVTY
jgi:hypothetical protein